MQETRYAKRWPHHPLACNIYWAIEDESIIGLYIMLRMRNQKWSLFEQFDPTYIGHLINKHLFDTTPTEA